MAGEHNALLRQSVREVLKPAGLLQKGGARIWVEDNGWFLTVAEFQGGVFDRGSWLNVGICFLWYGGKSIVFWPECSLDKSARVGYWVRYTGDDDAFRREMAELARLGLGKVKEYRPLAEIETAKNTMLYPCGALPVCGQWSRLLIAALAGDALLCRRRAEEILDSQYIPAADLIYANTRRLLARLDADPDGLRQELLRLIAAQRAWLRTRPGLKRLAVHPVYQ